MASGGKTPGKPDDRPQGGSGDPSKSDIGDALRSAYEDAVKEDIPAEMLDLLGKLD
ncbi:NepR family anti-sigma factor [Parasphingopyxis sp.]|uniref:NepR family anti-sigma factor n=1 Tax=Parasphingopyxis sp. TaxID=1920299 RepID=UPI00261FBCC2|nr:NepR family anti-sigma factor [Parasphingopyxis sp.]